MLNRIIRILIADDYALIRKNLMAILSRESDMEVIGTAVNGREAVDMAQTLQPDIILMDVSMPKLDGIRAAGEIKKMALPTQVIMLSMHYNSTLKQQAHQNGAVAYIAKQYIVSQLIPTIRDVFANQPAS